MNGIEAECSIRLQTSSIVFSKTLLHVLHLTRIVAEAQRGGERQRKQATIVSAPLHLHAYFAYEYGATIWIDEPKEIAEAVHLVPF